MEDNYGKLNSSKVFVLTDITLIERG